MVKSDKDKHIARDPHAEREAGTYDQPIPSREYILEFLDKQDRLLNRHQIGELLGLADENEIEGLRRRLIAMVRDGQLHVNRKREYGPIDKFDLVRGRVDTHPDGFGFLHPEDGSEKLFIPFRQMDTLLHGDRIIARVSGMDRRGRREAAVVEVLERGFDKIVGRYWTEHNVGFVAPDNKHIHQDILIPQEERADAQPGQFVMAEIVEYPTFRSQPIGRIVEVLGDHMAPGMEIDVAIRSHQIPSDWPQAVLDEVAPLDPEVKPADYQGRKDLRELAFVTIDGEDARDFDDAVYCEKKKKGWRLWVAIADVANYVRPGTALDNEAIERGNSVYFPERVVPMLPEILSNGLCSLNPKVDRLAMVCEIDFSSSGKIDRYRFYDGVIHSHARLTYNQVAGMLYEGHKGVRDKYQHVLGHLENLDALYQTLSEARQSRGAIDFESSETQFIFGENKKIERIVPVVRNDAHKIIEECMISANVCAARFLERHEIPGLFRIHEQPDPDRLNDLRDFLKPFGLYLKGGKEPNAMDYARLIDEIKDRPDTHLIQTVLLRSMQAAEYSPDNHGHFGLSLDEYAHFTSPIRRYPDLLVHRAIKHVNRHRDVSEYTYSHQEMSRLGEHCSMTERRADEATREAVSWLKCEFMMDKIDEEYNGIISGVTSFGLFVELENIYVEGLIHITALGQEYFHFDPIAHTLSGDRTGQRFRLGDKIRVKLVHVNLDERKIDFDLVLNH